MADGIGGRVVALRQRKGLSQAALAEAAYITAPYVALIERGKRRRPRESVLRSLAGALDTTVDYLVTGRDGQVHAHEVDLRFGEVAFRNGDPATARERFVAAYEDAAALGDGYVPEQREAQYGIARADWSLGRQGDAIAGFEALLDAHDLPSSVSRVALQTWLCRAYAFAGDLGRAIDLGENALAAVGPVTGPRAHVTEGLAELVSTLVWAYTERGDLTRAQQLIDSLVVAVEASGSMSARGAAYWNAAIVAEAQGEFRAAIKLADRAIALYGEIGNDFAIAALRINVAGYMLRLPGVDLAAAEAHLRESMGGLIESGHSNPTNVAMAEKELARCLLLAGRVDEAVDTARAALERVPAAPLERARVLAVLAAASFADGREDEAVACYEDAAAALTAYGAGRQAGPVWGELAAVLTTMERDKEAVAALWRMAAALGVSAAPIRPATAAVHSP
ncbi:MAG: helix-turn-helix domain-containing protein [Frankiaceae bacterium]